MISPAREKQIKTETPEYKYTRFNGIMVGALGSSVIQNNACQGGRGGQIDTTKKDILLRECENREEEEKNNGDANAAIADLRDPPVFLVSGAKNPLGKDPSFQTLEFEKKKSHSRSFLEILKPMKMRKTLPFSPQNIHK